MATSSFACDTPARLTGLAYSKSGNNLFTPYSWTYDEYDKEGNRTKRTKTSTNESTEYEWDYHNRLVKVTEKDSMGMTTKVVEYTYDVFNRRIAKQVDTTSPFDMADAAIERYVYDDIHNSLVSLDGGNVVLDFADPDGAGAQPMALAKRYLYGAAVDQILAQEDVTKNLSATDRVLWPLVDNLGTVRDLAKQDGTIAAHYQYDSYGNVTSGDTSLTRYLFTSRELDTDTGLQYNRARWYDPAVGRWVSKDPLGFVAGDGNVTRYVGNSGTRATDPSGLIDDPNGLIKSALILHCHGDQQAIAEVRILLKASKETSRWGYNFGLDGGGFCAAWVENFLAKLPPIFRHGRSVLKTTPVWFMQGNPSLGAAVGNAVGAPAGHYAVQIEFPDGFTIYLDDGWADTGGVFTFPLETGVPVSRKFMMGPTPTQADEPGWPR